MSLFDRFAKAISLGVILVSSASAATNPHITVRPKARVVSKIDTGKVTTVAHSHPGRISRMTDLGRLPASTPMKGMTLVLKSSDEQEYALVSLLDQQQDKSHANYHQWATPETFGAAFGVHSDDITKISAWLQSSGLSVDKVAKGGRFIQFSGESASVEKAFHTEMHSYLNEAGEKRISNTTDISIPEALTPVVRGVARLNNLAVKSSAGAATQGVRETDGTMRGVTPKLTTGGTVAGPTGTAAGSHFVGAADLAAIYDTAPLVSKGINGKGVTIGIVGGSDILPGDIAAYRSIFGLPVNPVKMTSVGADPGIVTTDPLYGFTLEAQGLIDTQIAGAMAPMATIVYASAGYNDINNLAGGYFPVPEDLSAAYLVDENVGDIIVDSFTLDEGSLVSNQDGTGSLGADEFGNISFDYSDLLYYQLLWEQAAAQGQSVFVTAGTGGPAAAKAGSTSGSAYSVNGIASTPYNVAVGSTELNEGASYSTFGPTPFWGAAATAAPYQSVLSYIPENAWNEGKYGTVNGTAITGAAGITSGGGGISAWNLIPNWQVGPATTSSGAPSTNVPTVDPTPGTGFGMLGSTRSPYYQIAGVAHRLMPDVSTTNGTHDGLIYCIEGSCTLSSMGILQGFSVMNGANKLTAGAATMAGIQALINQQQAALPANAGSPSGGRQGNPNFFYYRIAAAQSETACDSDTFLSAGSAVCGFHDIQTGNTYIPASTSTSAEIGWPAGVGYDLATGLGSPDAANLAALWSTVTFSPTTVGFNVVDFDNSFTQVSPIIITHGDYLGLTMNVFPVDSTGAPNGGVSDSNGNEIYPTGDVAIIAQTTNVNAGDAGFYTVTNATDSDGNPILGGCSANPNPADPTQTGTTSGTLCFGVPGDGNPYDSLEGGSYGMAGYLPTIPGGTYNLYAHYTGDAIYGASNSQLVAVTVAAEATTLVVDSYSMTTSGNLSAPTVLSFSYGQNVYLDSYTEFASGYGAPTGTVTFTLTNGNTTVTSIAKLDETNDAYFDAGPGSSAGNVLPTSPVLSPGIYNVSAKYSGDASFLGSTSNAFSITVNPVSPTIKATATTASVTTGSPATLIVTISNAAPAQFTGSYAAQYATGTVTFVDTTTSTTLGTSLPSQMVNGVCTFTTPALTTTGAHNIVATYNGDSNYATKAAAAVTVTVLAASTTTITVTAPATAQVGTSDSLVANVTPTTAIGAVYFYANGLEIGTANLATGKATLAYKNFAAGAYAISASYVGTATVGSATTTTKPTLTVTPNTPTVTVAAAPAGDSGSGYTISATLLLSPNNAGTATLPNPAPNPIFNFYQGTTLLGSAVGTYVPATFQYIANYTTKAVVPGASSIMATFVGDANYATASASETINLGATSLLFSLASPATVTPATTFTVTVVPAVPTVSAIGGTVQFADNGVPVGSPVTVSAAGVATGGGITAGATGTQTITANYIGDSHFSGSSATLTANLSGAPAFTIAVNPSALSIPQGGGGTVAVTATVTGNWTGSAPVFCKGVPNNTSCIFSFGNTGAGAFAFTGANGVYTGTLTIGTTDTIAARGGNASGLLWLPALLLAGFLGLRRKQMSLRGQQLMLMAILLFASLATSACSSGTNFATPAGASTITVVAAGAGSTAGSPNISPTATVSLTVTK